jgi:hypothetical protein
MRYVILMVNFSQVILLSSNERIRNYFMKIFILLLLFFNVAGSLFGNEKTSKRTIIVSEGILKGFKYVGEVDENNLPHGKGEAEGRDNREGNEGFVATNGLITVKGDFVHGTMTGKVEYWEESFGTRYIGEMKNNEMHGHGVFIVSGTGEGLSGYRYEGGWKDGLKHGEGLMTYNDGSYTKGTYVENSLHGFVVKVIKNQYTYYGEYENGRETIGYIRWANGAKYVGEWGSPSDGKYRLFNMQGLGILTSQDGRIMVGEFKNGRPEGLTATKIPGVVTHVGERSDDKFNGMGYMELEREDRVKYLGNFLDNKRHGQGMTITETGEPTFGVWEHDKLIQSK